MSEHKIPRKNNFLYLTCALIVLIIAAALQEIIPDGWGHAFLSFVLLGTLLVAFLSLNFGTVWRKLVAAMALGWAVLSLLGDVWVSSFDHELPSLLILLIFFVGEAYFAARQVLLSGKQIDGNLMVGALALYLLIGLIWAMVFLLILAFSPDAFNGIASADYADNFLTAVYFSFVTMTSLGYGDISPAGPLARVATILSAISGAFYMAVIVASMVGARSSTRNRQN